MLETAEVLRLILWALALGVTLPVMIQLFLTLRQVRLTIARLSGQIEPSLRLFNEIAQKPRVLQTGASSVAAIVATVVPAAVAAYRAFRQQQAQEDAAESGSLETNMNEHQVPSGA
jgi:hypothetical protein